jgi:hypothetical protein
MQVPQSSAFITRREIEHLAEYIMDRAEAQIRRAEGESQQGMDHAMAVSMATSRALRLVSKALVYSATAANTRSGRPSAQGLNHSRKRKENTHEDKMDMAADETGTETRGQA